MSRARNHLSLVVDEVLADAGMASQRRDAEIQAIKVAAAAPKTDAARGLRSLADTLRAHSDDVSYDDLAGVL